MLRFEPQYKSTIWGGRRLAERFSRTLPAGPIGESWELADLQQHMSRVPSGPRAGELLGELWRNGALGGSARGEFPFLLKWLDTNDYLSVQVHPDEAACRRMGAGLPKSEAWLVAHCEPGANLYLGHRAGLDAEGLEQAAGDGSIGDWLLEIRPPVGTLVPVPAGTLHAIGPGYLLLEVQQPSDTTYRVYDWDRLDTDGRPRELHVAQASAAVNYERSGTPGIQTDEVVGPTFTMQILAPESVVPGDSLQVFVAHGGDTELWFSGTHLALERGAVVVAEPGDGDVRVGGEACVLITEPASSSRSE
jgi:mannose-6-phosphate isomerase